MVQQALHHKSRLIILTFNYFANICVVSTYNLKIFDDRHSSVHFMTLGLSIVRKIIQNNHYR